MSAPKTLYDKIVDEHRILSFDESGTAGERLLLYIDTTVLNEYTSPQAFSGLRAPGPAVWCPAASLGVAHPATSTHPDPAAVEVAADDPTPIQQSGQDGRVFGIDTFYLIHTEQVGKGDV